MPSFVPVVCSALMHPPLARGAAALLCSVLVAAPLLSWGCGDEGETAGQGGVPSSTSAGGGAGVGGGVGGTADAGAPQGGGGAGESCNGEDDDGDGQIDEGLEATCGGCGRPYDLAVQTSYPIYATWMFGRSSACEWQDELESFHRQGGQAVWQFGPSVTVRSADWLQTDPDSELAGCEDAGVDCVEAALADLVAANPANTVANWLTYDFGEDYSDAIMACPSLDRRIEVGERTYWRIVLPHETGQQSCAFDGGAYDVLFAWFEGVDSSSLLLAQADGLRMDVYLGMPAAPPLAGQTWNVDTALRPASLAWARRVLSDYGVRHAGHPSFAGVYQSFEVSLQAYGLDAVYDSYGMLGDAVHAALPGKRYALSPYWDVNTAQGGHGVASVQEGFKRLARQGADIIAPQDGRGTGKGALYWPFQETETIASVDPKLAQFPNVAPGATFGEQFTAATRELFDAAREAVTELESEGIVVDLWANLEAFENLTAAPCGYSWALERTDKPRLDLAVTMAGAQPSHVISFMWDAYYWCTEGSSVPALRDQILSDGARPIASGARIDGASLVVQGYHLAEPGTQLELTWYDASWTVQGATVAPTAVEAGWGAANGRMPTLDQVTVPFDPPSLAPSFYVHVRPVGPGDLRAYHAYSLSY